VRVEIERQWLAEDRIGLLAGRRSVTNWGAFQATRQPGVLLLGIRLGAADYIAAIELSHGLTEALLEGLLGLDRPEAAGYLQTDWGCLEFLFGRLCEGLGRPFLLEREVATALPAAEIGLAIELVTSIRDRQGMVRIFLPERSRHALTLEPVPCRRSPRAIPWQARIELAAIELSGQEAQSLRPGDVVLILPDPVARLGSSPFGFRLELSDSNFSTLRADKQVERLIRLDTSSALQSLPLSLQVILAEREFTLADLEKLGAGTVIELGRDESSPVQLALNGKLMGTGTLVRIEGHLGVRVVGWAGDE
jgi:flagellar motor switch/type III secretory pathway protein FliN